MEPLDADDIDDALREADRLMRRHSSAIAVHVFQAGERVQTLLPDPPQPSA
jgi:hypothetical protein